MSNTKLIFIGPVGAGKTTAIHTAMDADMVCTDERATDMTAQWKETTTVALDYGALALQGGQKLHLYGLPGQERFRFMWDILSLGGDGIVLLLDNSRPAPLQDLNFYLGEFSAYAEQGALVVAVTKTDLTPTGLCIEDYRQALAAQGVDCPVCTTDVRDSAAMVALINQALISIEGDQASCCVA